MRFELELVRASVAPNPTTSTTPHRKDLRVATDALIADGQLDLTALVERTCSIMLVVARTLTTFEQDPQSIDFYEACAASIENARAVMDKGLLLNSWETVRCGAVMLEITVRGVCAALSVPYDLVLAEVHRAQLAGEAPDVRRILMDAGLIARPSLAAAVDKVFSDIGITPKESQ